MKSRTSCFAEAMRLLSEGRSIDALQIGDRLAASEDEGDRLNGYLCRGYVYEDGGADISQDLDRSLQNFRHAVMIVASPLGFCNLARVSMKKGTESGYQHGYRYLVEAETLGVVPEVLLGFAEYHRHSPQKNLDTAKLFYLRAASRGTFAGFFGYSEVAREMGQRGRALVMDCVRIALGPLLVVLIGRRTQDRF